MRDVLAVQKLETEQNLVCVGLDNGLREGSEFDEEILDGPAGNILEVDIVAAGLGKNPKVADNVFVAKPREALDLLRQQVQFCLAGNSATVNALHSHKIPRGAIHGNEHPGVVA